MNDSTYPSFCLQPLLFDPKDLPCSYTKEDLEFNAYLDMMLGLLSASERARLFSVPQNGRKGYSLYPILAIQMLKSYCQCRSAADVRKLLRMHPAYMDIIGITKIPSKATLSRRTAELAEAIDISGLHARLAAEFYRDRVVCNLSIDSTPVDCYEKPVKKEKSQQKKRKGRKKKGSEEEKEYLDQLLKDRELKELRNEGDIREFLSTLENRCSVTGKKNSKGNMAWRIGYKIHLAVDDNGIPVAYVVTGACVHDSVVAIPLLRMANSWCFYCYALMDAGYCSEEIEDFVRKLGKVPVIDQKKGRDGKKPEMDPAKKARYRSRTTVERTNSELKGGYLPDHLHSRAAKARLDMEIAILLLTMKRMRMVLRREEKQRMQIAA